MIGRMIEANYGAFYANVRGVIYGVNADNFLVRFEDGTKGEYAKFRILTSEVDERDVPDAVGVYLIAQ